MTTAVEDRPIPKPAITAKVGGRPKAQNSAAKAPPATIICRLPKPKILPASARMRPKEKCRPRLNSRNITPASAIAATTGPLKSAAIPRLERPSPMPR